MSLERYMGIDYGDSRVGVAVSDLLGLTAQGVGTVKNKGKNKLIEELYKLIKQFSPSKIIIGMPKNMDGSEGFRADSTYAFADELKKVYDGEIIFFDERLTTVAASAYLNATNTRGEKRKAIIDTVSACIILQNYMDFKKSNR